MSATKTAVIDSYTQDSQVTYAINILNSGTVSFAGLTITDNLGEYPFGTGTLVPLTYVDNSVRYYVNGVLQMAPSVVTTIIYVAEANEYAPLALDSLITNTATISGTVFLTLEESSRPLYLLMNSVEMLILENFNAYWLIHSNTKYLIFFRTERITI